MSAIDDPLLSDHTFVSIIANEAVAGNSRGTPKIVPSSCGEVRIRENRAVDNLIRVFAVLEGGNAASSTSRSELSSSNNSGGASEIAFRIEGRSAFSLFSY